MSEAAAAAINQAAAALDHARADLRDAVMEARRAGATWQDVGDVFGISRQAAWERFR